MKEVLLQDFLHVLLGVIITPILAEVEKQKQMPLDIPNVPKNILKAHEEQVYKKTTPMILITEPFLI